MQSRFVVIAVCRLSSPADRIVVLGGKPAHIERIIDVTDARPRDAENSFFFDLHRDVLATLERGAA